MIERGYKLFRVLEIHVLSANPKFLASQTYLALLMSSIEVSCVP